jgi:hypothetical protein
MLTLLAALSLIPGSGVCAQSAAARAAAREIAEAIGRETLERAEPRLVSLIEAYGDDAVRVLRRSGAAAVPVLEKHGAAGLRILSKWGDDGLRVLASQGDAAVQALARHGESAVEFMIRHPGAGADFVAAFGGRALRTPLETGSVITLNRLAEPIRASGRSAELLGVVERFGDRACGFLWRHKGTIFAGALLASFLADPQPYLDGVRELVVEPAAGLAREAVRATNWTLIAGLGLLLSGAAAWALLQGRRKARAAA